MFDKIMFEYMLSHSKNICYLQTKKIPIILSLAISSCILSGQNKLTIEGTSINNSTTDIWYGVNVPRSVPTTFKYLNNYISSVNNSGYVLQAGDEDPGI